jgi:16S rRNA (guanine966-N2)-methyltransferase
MRIVAGRWRGHTIKAPADDRVRPTADRVREAWMSIVQPELPGARVLDLFAGSGALGLEALSRGAEHCDFVEIGSRSLAALRANIGKLEAEDATIVRGDALKFIQRLERGAYDIAFADPPYGMNLAARVAERWLEVPFASLLGVEHGAKEQMPAGGETRKYGDTRITFYRLSS